MSNVSEPGANSNPERRDKRTGRDRLTPQLQESVLRTLARDDQIGQRIANKLKDAELFDEGPHHEMAARILAYRFEHKRPPGDEHLDDLFDDILSDEKNRMRGTYQRFIVAILDTTVDFNPAYVEKRLDEWLRYQHLKQITLDVALKLQHESGKDLTELNDGVEHMLSQALPARTHLFSLSSLFSQPPICAELAFSGLAGDIVKRIEPTTEADRVALLVQLLACFGNCIGRSAFVSVGNTHHYPKLFLVLVGNTAKSRKGQSFNDIRALFARVDDEWVRTRINTGISSGEGLIWSVRDATNSEDDGVKDKRLLVQLGEYAQALAVMSREGSTLASVVRDAWDDRPLCNTTKKNPVRADDTHVSIIGHITAPELREHLRSTEMASGYANRFVYFHVARSKELPFPSAPDLSDLSERLAASLYFAREAEEVAWSRNAEILWLKEYHRLSNPEPGLIGAICARAEAQVIRIALLYALLDGKSRIGENHLRSALALWDYAEQSVKYIFANALGSSDADTIYQALLEAGERGLRRSDIYPLFEGHINTYAVSSALNLLERHNLARKEVSGTKGRARETWYALEALRAQTSCEKSEESEKRKKSAG